MRSKSTDSEWLRDCGSAQHGAICEALLWLNLIYVGKLSEYLHKIDGRLMEKTEERQRVTEILKLNNI